MSRSDADGGAVARLLAIKSLPLFADVHADELAVIADHAQVRSFSAGETVLSAADGPVTGIHLVLEGKIVEHRDGRPFRTHEPLRVLGGVDALAESTAAITAVAEVDTRTLAIERAALREVLEDNWGVLSVTLQGVAAAILRLRRALTPTAGFAAVPAAPPLATPDDLGARIAFLRRHWIGHARVRTLGQLARDAELVRFADGAPAWREEEIAEHALLLVDGTVDCATADGRQRFAAATGAVIGLEEVLAIAPRWCDATARGRVAALRFTRAAIIDVLEDDSETALEAVAALAAVASALRDRVAHEGVET